MGVKAASPEPNRITPADPASRSASSWVARLQRRILRELWGIEHQMSVEAVPATETARGGRQTHAPDRVLRLRSSRGVPPCGWVAVSCRWRGGQSSDRLTLLAETTPQRAESYVFLGGDSGHPIVLRLPPRVHGLRLQAPAGVERLGLQLQITELGAVPLGRALLRPYVDAVHREPGMAWHFFRRALDVLLRHGRLELQATLRSPFVHEPERYYDEWVRRYDRLTARDAAAARRQLARFRWRPMFTLLVALDDPCALESMQVIRSVRDQWYPDWQLLLIETRPLAPEARAAVHRLSGDDVRIRSVESAETLPWSEAANRALLHATGAFCATLDGDAVLAPHALHTIAAECNAYAEAALIYSDEDRIDASGQRFAPSFKPDWNPDLLRNQPFLGRLTVYRTSLLREVGGWRAGLNGLEDWDLALRASAAVPDAHIRHVPHVLYHTCAATPRVAESACASGAIARQIVSEHLQRLGAVAEVDETADGRVRIRYAVGTPPPLVSIIIPTRNGLDLLQRCVAGLRESTDYPNLEVLIVDNQSDDPATLAYLGEVQTQPHIRVLRFDEPFNFSAVNNYAAARAHGAILALLNNDVQVTSRDWLFEMVGHALRREVGAVGAKLYYPDGRIQHAGVILGLGKLAGHAYRGLPEPEPGPDTRTFFVQNLSAVTAACLVLRAEIYRAMGGLDVSLPVAYGDVDLCLRLRQRGYRIVWTPHAQGYHWESATRGLDHSLRKVRRLRREQALMLQRWGAALDADPAYNPNLTLAAPGFALAFPPRVGKPWNSRG